jgi:hypothetical protein
MAMPAAFYIDGSGMNYINLIHTKRNGNNQSKGWQPRMGWMTPSPPLHFTPGDELAILPRDVIDEMVHGYVVAIRVVISNSVLK